MKITLDYYNSSTDENYLWNYYSHIKDLKAWLNCFGFNVIKVVLNDDFTCVVQTENPVQISILKGLIDDLQGLKLVSFD